MQPTEQLARIVSALDGLVARLTVDDLGNPTPGDRGTVHDVLDRLMVLGGSGAHWFRGEEAPVISAPPVYGWVPVREFRTAMHDLLEAVHSDGAMDRTIATPSGEMNGDTFARLVAVDALTHGRDVATATGVEFQLAADVIAAVDGFACGLDRPLPTTNQHQRMHQHAHCQE